MQSPADQLNSTLDGWLTKWPEAVYCVIDSASGSVLALLGIDQPQQPTSLLTRLKVPAAQLPSELLPALVRISPDNWQLRQRTVEIALDDFDDRRAPRVCGWVTSATSIAALAMAFESSLLRFAPDRHRFLFRHHDPRVRACLTALLGDRWMSAVMRNLGAWLFIGLDKRPMQTSSWSDEDESRHDAIRVHQAIARCEEINQAIELACTQGWAFQANAYNVADAALSRAEAFAFKGAADRLAYMLHALMLAPNFDAHPEINAVLRSAHALNESYVDAASRIPARTWQAAQGIEH
jgi:Domain of unknown function (DUF4123)